MKIRLLFNSRFVFILTLVFFGFANFADTLIASSKQDKYADRLAREQFFIFFIEDELDRIDIGQEEASEKISHCLYLLKIIIENRDVTKNSRIDLFEKVETLMKKLISQGKDDINQTATESTQKRSPGSGNAGHGNDGLNLEGIMNVNATPDELQGLVEALASLKRNIKDTSFNNKKRDLAYLIGVPAVVSLGIGIIGLVAYHKLYAKKPTTINLDSNVQLQELLKQMASQNSAQNT